MCATAVEWVEAMDSANYSLSCSAQDSNPTMRNDQAQGVKNAETEKPDIEGISKI